MGIPTSQRRGVGSCTRLKSFSQPTTTDRSHDVVKESVRFEFFAQETANANEGALHSMGCYFDIRPRNWLSSQICFPQLMEILSS